MKRAVMASVAAILAACSSSSEGGSGGSSGSFGGGGGSFGFESADTSAGSDTAVVGGDAATVGAPDGAAASDTGGWSTSGPADIKPKVDLPPEKEPEAEFGVPEGSPNYVYIPVTDADRLVRVSGATLKVSLIDVSSQPFVVKTVPNQDAAIVLHKGANEAVIVRSSEDKDVTVTLPVLAYANSLQVDPAGGYAVAWYNHALNKANGPVGSFQAVSLLRLQDGQDAALTLSTGFRPSAVQFTQNGAQALIVTEDGVCIVDLQKAKDGQILVPVPVTQKPLLKVSREVLATDDGVWAVVREGQDAAINVVHLPTGKLVTVPLLGAPTDIDLVPGGKAALLVLRNEGYVARLELPAAPTETFQVVNAPMGDVQAGLARITDDGKTALLYTSVPGIEQVATLDLATGIIKAVSLKKTVDNVWMLAGSRKAILLHKPAQGPNYDDATEKFVDDAEGYTLFDLDTGFTKLVTTPVKPLEIAFSANPDKAWLLLPDPADVNHVVQEAALKTFLTADHALGSRPEHARFLVKAGAMAVTQKHPSGRITFLNATTGAAKTVTGYELNGKVK